MSSQQPDTSNKNTVNLTRRLVSEGLGTALLAAAVVGSGMMGERFAGDSVYLMLFAHTIGSAAGLLALILAFGHISGAHLNPAVTLSMALQRNMRWGEAAAYMMAQCIGAFVGVAATQLMFVEPLFLASDHIRTGFPQWFSEFIAAFGLIAVIIGCSRGRPSATPFAAASYLAAAYWFTASMCFVNPAITLVRAATHSFTGISFESVPAFLAAQFLGAIVATVIFSWLHRRPV